MLPSLLFVTSLLTTPVAAATPPLAPNDEARFRKIGTDLLGIALRQAEALSAEAKRRLPPIPPPLQPTPSSSEPSTFFELPVQGYNSALVSIPRDTGRPRPVLVVAHGARVDPEWQCSVWQEAIGDRAFILRPRGDRTTRDGNEVYVWGSSFAAIMDASIAALRARFGPRVDPGPMVFNGYSQGAYLAPQYVMKNVQPFPRVVMTEGGQHGWNPQAFAKAGGTRMLFACGQADCERAARPVTRPGSNPDPPTLKVEATRTAAPSANAFASSLGGSSKATRAGGRSNDLLR